MIMNIERIKIDVAQLSVGLPLKYDLQTLDGHRLAQAGELVTADLKKQWHDEGIQIAEAVVRRSSDAPTVDPETEPPNPGIIQRLGETINQASYYVLNSALKIARGEPTGTSEIKNMVNDIKNDIASDVAAVLTAFAKSLCVELSDNDQLLAQRSSQLSLLGLLIAHQLNYEEDDLQAIAMAGIFHDISLLDCVRNGNTRMSHATFATHSALSAALFDSAVTSNPKVSIAISQLHEQIDGTGFPKQLRLGRIIPIARVLNVADAYLTLTSQKEPELFPKACSFHPADAVGYLMYHTARGRFDRRVVRALIDVASLYPVGCRVELSDQSTAIVLRSSSNEPTKPIVRLEKNHAEIVDLKRSQLSILRPSLSAMDHCFRLRKSRIGDVYWR